MEWKLAWSEQLYRSGAVVSRTNWSFDQARLNATCLTPASSAASAAGRAGSYVLGLGSGRPASQPSISRLPNLPARELPSGVPPYSYI